MRLTVPIRTSTVRFLERTGNLERALEARQRYRVTRDRAARQTRLKVTTAPIKSFVGDDPDVMIATAGVGPRQVRAVLARRRNSAKAADAIRANRALVVDTLTAHGIAHESIPISSPNRTRIAVSDGARDQLLSWLRSSTPPTTYIYFDTTTISPRNRIKHLASTSLSRLRALGHTAWVWRVFEYRADAGGVDLFGDLHGCEIEFWGFDEITGRLFPRRWNAAIGSITARKFGLGERHTDIPTSVFDTIEFPIDIVYTWVDGDDPQWRERRRAALRSIDRDALHGEASSAARYESRDELRYSLRSVEKFAEFVNHIYIVTDDQCPPWLHDDHPNVTVVSHRQIFTEPDDLPTFNSHSIESRLHHIPDLAEHYLYLNDDFFFGRRVLGSRFFHSNGLARFFLSRALIPLGRPSVKHKPVDSAAMNGRDLVQSEFGVSPTQKFKHAPYPQLRSVHLDLERRFPKQIARTTSSRVRSPSDLALASSLHHQVAYLTGRATPGEIATQYIDLGQANLEGRLYELLGSHDVDTFCLNDADSETITAERKRELVHEFLEAYFPEKSSFER